MDLSNVTTSDLVQELKKREGVDIPRAYSDYDITIGEMPSGVTCMRM